MAHYSKFPWTAAALARLCELHATGLSFELISRDLGCTRNAAIGKFHRLGVKSGIRPPPKPKPVGEKRLRGKPSTPPLNGILSLRGMSPRRLIKPAPSAPVGVPAGILDVTGCKYAVAEDAKTPGGFKFCNSPTADDRPWCEHHHAIVTQPAWGKFAMKRLGP
jgi:hypothetical protein